MYYIGSILFACGLCPNSGGGGHAPPPPAPELHVHVFRFFVSLVLRGISFHIKFLLDFLYIAILSQL